MRVRVKIMGSPKYENAEKSQSVLIMNDPIISPRTRIIMIEWVSSSLTSK
jgi:hypothetical protein|eukprot:COSAG01_NODE_4073_length_5381_cov_3.511170_9_plen_50_part_00